ncbi:MAG: efflux RND transporter periplasmic adaptor subunit, partial [Bacteroidota bacterium]
MQMILNRNFLFLVIIALLAAGCAGTDDDSSKLEQLKKEREALDKQIRQLEQQIIADGGTVEETSRVPAVVAEKVEPEVFNHYIEVRGSVESDQNIFVPAQRPYMVEKIYVDEGDYVTKGQLMAELDNESIRQSIREVKNGLELATTLFERQENLWEKNIGTEVQYLQAKNRMEDLQIKLRNVETELEKTRIFSPIDG